MNSLHRAIKTRNWKEAQRLRQHVDDVEFGKTLLMDCVYEDDYEKAQILICLGADPAFEFLVDMTDNESEEDIYDGALITAVNYNAHKFICLFLCHSNASLLYNPPHWTIALRDRNVLLRKSVIALLGIKRFGGLKCIDRFLIRELALAIWCARLEYF